MMHCSAAMLQLPAARNRTGLRDATGPWTFGYDALNRPTSATHPLWPDQTYGYDPLNRLASARHPMLPDQGFTCDAAGQLVWDAPILRVGQLEVRR